jgi:hypothetical protein
MQFPLAKSSETLGRNREITVQIDRVHDRANVEFGPINRS